MEKEATSGDGGCRVSRKKKRKGETGPGHRIGVCGLA
jgi:hypothetical protein